MSIAHRGRPGAVGALLGVQMLEAGEVAAGEDQVHALLVLDVEVADRAAAVVGDAEAERLGAAAAQLAARDDEPEPVLRDREAADRVGRGLVGALLGHVPGRLAGLRRGAAGLDRAACQRRGGEGDDEEGHEGGETDGRVHTGRGYLGQHRTTYPQGVGYTLSP